MSRSCEACMQVGADGHDCPGARRMSALRDCIEALRAENDRLAARVAELEAALDHVAGEVERLRGLLRDAINYVSAAGARVAAALGEEGT